MPYRLYKTSYVASYGWSGNPGSAYQAYDNKTGDFTTHIIIMTEGVKIICNTGMMSHHSLEKTCAQCPKIFCPPILPYHSCLPRVPTTLINCAILHPFCQDTSPINYVRWSSAPYCRTRSWRQQSYPYNTNQEYVYSLCVTKRNGGGMTSFQDVIQVTNNDIPVNDRLEIHTGTNIQLLNKM